MSRLVQLTTKVDAMFARVHDRYADDMQCSTGCFDCCRARFSITAVEADAIRAGVARGSVVPNGDLNVCAALAPNGRCQIYDVRPVVCRSHGAPIRLGADVSWCPRNFHRTVPTPESTIDQTTLSTILLAIDREAGVDRPRVELAALVNELAT